MDINQYRTPQRDLSSIARFMREFLTVHNRFINRMNQWAVEARALFRNPVLLKQLFVLERNFLARFSAAELAVLYRRWGHETFAAVTADLLFPAPSKPRTDAKPRGYRMIDRRRLSRVAPRAESPRPHRYRLGRSHRIAGSFARYQDLEAA